MNTVAEAENYLEPRPLFGIGTVARMTGIKADTLRVWERRYGLMASLKSSTGRRQYTQSDIDHLRLIASLVRKGIRIGEIAAADRKTLEMLVEQQGLKQTDYRAGRPKVRVLFIGSDLCQWVERHQGLISGLSAFLTKGTLADAFDTIVVDEPIDLLAVHCPSLTMQEIRVLEMLAERLEARRSIVFYQFANDQWISELEKKGHVALPYPPESSRLAFEFGRAELDIETSTGADNFSDLMPAKPRMFTEQELLDAAEEKIVIDCECPRHLAELIKSLNAFELYSSACSVDNWKDAAIHANIYTYTCQARHLLEKALQSALESRSLDLE